MPTTLQVLAGLVPSLGVGFLFWLAIRSIVQGDRRERMALARLDENAGADTVNGPSTSAHRGENMPPDAEENVTRSAEHGAVGSPKSRDVN